jgi:hypothetical protein
MNVDMERNAKIIRKMKGIPGGRGLRFPIRDKEMNVIGYMRGFDELFLTDDALIETMARAHTFYNEYFLTQFNVTPENKKNWLTDHVIGNDDKMLFLIETIGGKIVGQEGFTLSPRDNTFALDASMRWGRGGGSAIFGRSGAERMAIGFYLLGFERCVAEIFRKNEIVIYNVTQYGFEMETEYSLKVTEKNGTVIYSKTDDPASVNTSEVLSRLSIGRDKFAKLHGAIIENPCWSEENCGEIFFSSSAPE